MQLNSALGDVTVLSVSEARAIVEEAIADFTPADEEWVILDQHTIEKPWGWVFFYNSQEYATTGDPKYQLIGNAPYIVNKETGELVDTGTAEDIEVYIADYEATLGRVGGSPNKPLQAAAAEGQPAARLVRR